MQVKLQVICRSFIAYLLKIGTIGQSFILSASLLGQQQLLHSIDLIFSLILSHVFGTIKPCISGPVALFRW